ncbi:MAG: hypothetical protein CMJ65_11290 [Planctomycetaceae bacterium]|nr:hypothetical protein [Planctomycetaceae bacterium]MDP7277172.1 hemerythrin domain-containing protein [Planctomycetaceae bacterium]
MNDDSLRWSRQIASEHRRLRRSLSCLSQFLVDPASVHRVDPLLSRLEQLAEIVADHMALEERGGYLEPVCERLPHAAETLEKCLDEHDVLQKDLAELIDSLHAGPSINSVHRLIFPGLLSWIAALEDHEHRETELLIEAFWTDYGVAD